ncbi:MAG: hypothetical protein ACPG7F_00255 [Aggregatilineales bacterium]
MASLLEVIANAKAHGWRVEKTDCLVPGTTGCWVYYTPEDNHRYFHMHNDATAVEAWKTVIDVYPNLRRKLSDHVHFVSVSSETKERLIREGILSESDFYTAEED